MITYVSWSSISAYRAMHPSVKPSLGNVMPAQQAGSVVQDKANWRPVVVEVANATAVKNETGPK
ncbi:MAG: hypothetical protein ORN52_12525 [Beijerinckiaceae bacterium]|nr:hypothetical protein [Beijerinckiaceae bacterium]